MLHLLAHEAERRRVALLTNLQDVPSVLGDRIQLQQVLLNLAMNAIDAMSDIKERKPELLVLTAETESGVLVSVKDCGHGIKPEDVDRVFRPFHTAKSGGMGMGLAISRSIIEKHGGSLWAEVNDDFGATFKFALPHGGNSES